MACNDLYISVLACKSVVVMVMDLMSVTYNVSTLSICADVNWGSGVRVRVCVREGVSQGGSEAGWQ